MPEEIKVQLVDAYGKPLKHQFAPAADRAQIATKVYYYFSTQPEVQDFLTEILIKTVDTQISDAENLQISIDSQKFQKVCQKLPKKLDKLFFIYIILLVCFVVGSNA